MPATLTAPSEARRIQRISLSLPTRVETFINPDVSWEEITRLKDVSAFGAGFCLKRPIKRGRLVCMTFPMPRQLRCYDFSESQYKVWGIVRRCLLVESDKSAESYALGVGFIGKHPPLSYFRDPAKIFEVSHCTENGLWQIYECPQNPDESHLSKEDRRHSRYQIPVNLTLETLDPGGNLINNEQTVTENISLSGASVFCSLNAEIGTFVRVISEQYNVSIISIVRGKRIGQDNIPRLHIEFVDRFFPLEGID